MFINTSVSKWKKAEEGNRKERKVTIKHCSTNLWFVVEGGKDTELPPGT